MLGNITIKTASICFATFLILLGFTANFAIADQLEKDTGLFEIKIGSPLNISPGQSISVPIIKTAGSELIHGFDFLISFDALALTCFGVTPGEIFDDPGAYEWEYFSFRIDSGTTGDPQTGNIRIVGVANTNNGEHGALELYIPDGTRLFTLDFVSSDDPIYENFFTPITFYWIDCGDNAIAYGDSLDLALSAHVYEFDGEYYEITDTLAEFPTYYGAPTECFDTTSGKSEPVKLISYYNGGVEFGELYMECRLEVFVNDTTIYANQEAVISVYMNNYLDSIAGFELLLMLEHPDLCRFLTGEITVFDTTYWRCLEWVGPDCIDSLDVTDSVYFDPSTEFDWLAVDSYTTTAGAIDTSGTLCSGWEYIDARSLGQDGYNIRIVGLANMAPTPHTPGIPPQSGGVPLIKIPVEVYDTFSVNNVAIYIQGDNLDYFSFSDPQGNIIGLVTDTIVDTSWFNCLSWNEDSSICYLWEQIPDGPADSFWCCDTLLYGHLDTNVVCINHGSLTVLDEFLCGDINANETLNLLDITGFINCLYGSVEPPCDLSMMDVNCDGMANILDVVFIIGHLYLGGPAPNCIYCSNQEL